MKTLTLTNAKKGTTVICKDHPEWGKWELIKRVWDYWNGWEICSERGTKVIDHNEFQFWAIVLDITKNEYETRMVTLRLEFKSLNNNEWAAWWNKFFALEKIGLNNGWANTVSYNED